jgi:hypothetical protein
MSEQEPDERERREAEALARALESQSGAPQHLHGQPSLEGRDADAPGDALESALLLRYARGEDQASPQLLARARERAQRPSSARKSRVRRALVAASLAVAASFMLVFAAERSMAPMASERTAAPVPSSARSVSSLGLLIAAQGELLKSPEQPLESLELATARRRATLFAELDAHYGGRP